MATPAAKETALAAPINDRVVEYQAFGTNENIKLTIPMVRQWLTKPTRNGQQASDGDVLRFMMLCKARQLNPWEGDAFLVGYDGKAGPEFNLITAHQAFLKRAELNPAFDGMRSGVIVTNSQGEVLETEGDFVMNGHTLVGGWCDVHRKDQTWPRKARLKLATFDKQRSLWNTNAAGMIVKCAESDALRSAFPNTLAGLYHDAEMRPLAETASEKPAAPDLITEPQRVALVQLAKATGANLAQIVTDAGFGIMAQITVEAYDAILAAVASAGKYDVGDEPEPEAAPPAEPEGEDVIEGELVTEDEPVDPIESLRANLTAKLEELPKPRQKDLMAGKPTIGKMSGVELAGLADLLSQEQP